MHRRESHRLWDGDSCGAAGRKTVARPPVKDTIPPGIAHPHRRTPPWPSEKSTSPTRSASSTSTTRRCRCGSRLQNSPRTDPVAPNLVYFVLGGAKGKAKRKAGQKRRASVANRKSGNKTGMTDPITLILELKALAERAGGIANLKRLVDVLAE